MRLLGQLLASALFPQDMPPDLKALSQADSLLVCLHVRPGNDLADIPWELAADPFSKRLDRFMAADTPFQFIRIANGAESVPAPARKPPGSVRVLSVVAQPARWVHVGIPTPSGGRHPWPKAPVIRDGLRAAVARSGLTVTSLAPPLPSRLEKALRQPYDVLHYMGTGMQTPDGPKIVFADETVPTSELWMDVRTVLEAAARAGVQLVVLELMRPPEDKDFQQFTCSAFGDVVTGTVTAVVLTNLPVYPDQCKEFNDELYRLLSCGIDRRGGTGGAPRPQDRRSDQGHGWVRVVHRRRDPGRPAYAWSNRSRATRTCPARALRTNRWPKGQAMSAIGDIRRADKRLQSQVQVAVGLTEATARAGLDQIDSPDKALEAARALLADRSDALVTAQRRVRQLDDVLVGLPERCRSSRRAGPCSKTGSTKHSTRIPRTGSPIG